MKKSASILTVISFLLTAHAESIVWNKDNDFNNWRHFFNVSGKIENGTEVSGWVYVMHNLPEMAQVIESGSWKEYRHG